MPGLQFDDDISRRVESTYTTPDVVEQRRIALSLLRLRPGEDALDIGSGPGFLAREMAAAVGSRGSVHGLDPSEPMLAIARRLEIPADSAPVAFMSGSATELPYADESFDAVTATQVYEYVDDMATALDEARRVLRPGGRLLVLDTDWDSVVWRADDRDRMARFLEVWDEHLVDPHLPQTLAGLLRRHGLEVMIQTTIPMLNIGYDERSYSAGLIGFMSAFVTGRGGLTATDVEAWSDDLKALGPDYFFSVNRYVFIGVK